MKKIFYVLAIFFLSNTFSQNTVELNLSAKEYKKILKSLDLKITNRGYDAVGPIWVKIADYNADRESIYSRLWNEALFEMDMPLGQITDSSNNTLTIDADWIFQIEGRLGYNAYGGELAQAGGFSGKILDFSNNNKIVATFRVKEKMNFIEGMGDGEKRSEKFKNIVKVIVNEILLTIK